MYAPTNTVINTIMRWPVLAAVGSAATALSTTGLVHDTATAIAGAVGGVIGATKLFHEQVCDCESKGYTKQSAPKIQWIIEYDASNGHDRPWKIFSMFGGIESTKQHYASYSTEEHAKSKIELLQKISD